MPDIIIPILNEEQILTEKFEYYKTLGQMVRILFVDGGSVDQSVEIAQNYGKVIISSAGRAIQKNRGAETAISENLLFLHVDTFIPDYILNKIDHALDEGAVGGCLTMHIEDKGFIFRIYEIAVNFRARMFGVIDGDLGTFVRKDIFEQMGGFDLIPVMEDLVFGKKLRKFGSIKVLNEPIYVSSRKWYKKRFIRTFIEYTLAYIQLWTGQLKSLDVREEYCQIK